MIQILLKIIIITFLFFDTVSLFELWRFQWFFWAQVTNFWLWLLFKVVESHFGASILLSWGFSGPISRVMIIFLSDSRFDGAVTTIGILGDTVIIFGISRAIANVSLFLTFNNLNRKNVDLFGEFFFILQLFLNIILHGFVYCQSF